MLLGGCFEQQISGKNLSGLVISGIAVQPLCLEVTCGIIAFGAQDDRLVRQCGRVQPDVWYGTPVAFCDEENLR